jgi:hypothetical protein
MSNERYRNLTMALTSAHQACPTNKMFRILEVGTHDGNRATQLIQLAQRLGRRWIEYHGFDLFEKLTHEHNKAELGNPELPPSLDQVYDKLSSLKADVYLYQGFSCESLPGVVPGLIARQQLMSLIFIDGGHSPATMAHDLHWCTQLLVPDRSVLIMDGYYEDRGAVGCREAVDKLDQSAYAVTVLDPIDRREHLGLSVRMVCIQRH